MTDNPDVLKISEALHAGRLAEAETACRAELVKDPGNELVLLLLAISLHWQDRYAEAAATYEDLLERIPASSTYWNNYGVVLHAKGDHPAAEAAFAKAVEFDPTNSAPHISRGLMLMELRQPRAARASLLEAVRLDPALPLARIHAARACNFCRDAKAGPLLQGWQQWLPLEPDLQLALAHEKFTLGDAPAAQHILEELYARAPDNVDANLQLAKVYERMNRSADARALLDQVERIPGRKPGVELELARQHAMLLFRSGDLDQARQLLNSGGPSNDNDYGHFFMLAKVCDKQGDTDAAMTALAVAHQRQIAEIELGCVEHVAPGAAVLPAAVPRISADEYRTWPTLNGPTGAQSPIFIVGFPRSGTTLLEQMLDAHPSLQSMDERPFFNILADDLIQQGANLPHDLGRLSQLDCDELRRRYTALVCSKIERRWSAQLVDKNPLNMLWVPFIQRLFPQAKFILALRHPCDVLLSCYMQNFRAGVLVAASATLERLAQAYVSAMDNWLHHVDVFQSRVLVSRYEELVADLPAHSRRIAQFLELEDATPLERFDAHAREKGYIATPSYTQVIEPVNRKGINRWQRYRREFEPVLPILEPMLQHWGYSTDAEK